VARFGFVGPSYRSQSVNADAQMCMNWYVEAIESQQGKGAMALLPTPGLLKLYDLGKAGVRQKITAQGRTFAVAGTALYELLAPGSNPNVINRGPIANDGQPCSMTSGPTQVLIASAGFVYVFNLTTNTLTADISGTVGGAVSQVGYMDGFFLALFKNSNKIQASGTLDATVWPGGSATVVSVFTDNIVGMFVDHRELWVWGPKATQPYYDSGNFPFPFDVRDGALIESGLAAAFSPAKADNSIFWLEGDDRGNCMVRRANGYTPARVSNHAVEYALSTYSTIADAVGYSYKDQGHEFYVLNFPTAEKTWAYDTATSMWAERGFWNTQTGIFTRHRAQYHTFNYGMHLVGDPTVGAVYQMSTTLYTDFGQPIRRVRRAPHISLEQQWSFHHELQVDVEVGLGPTFQGNATGTFFFLADPTGATWQVSVTDAGDIVTAKLAGTATTFFLNDSVALSSWQFTVNASGDLLPVSVGFNAAYLGGFTVVSSAGNQNFNLIVKDLGGGVAQFQAAPLGIVTRGPLMMMRYSNDATRTWIEREPVDCGQAGEYQKRVIWRRLGRSRDRIYEISVSDPFPCRIIDAYLKATNNQPQERLIKELGKRA
jgi:hypothetical protein